MSITLRSNKGSSLTHAELDANFSDFMVLSGAGASRSLTNLQVPGTTQGGVIYGAAANVYTSSAAGTAGQILASSGTSAPYWTPNDLTSFPTSNFKKSVKVATTANITLSGTQTIDGIAVVAGDRVLVKNQTTTSQNGIYIVSASTWTRSTAADGSTEIDSAVVGVDQGTTNGGLFFTNVFKTTDTVGTTAMPWYKVTTDSDLITSGSTAIGAVRYSGTTRTTGQFYGGTTTPNGTTRLNYSGYFYPTFLNLIGSSDTTTVPTHFYVETGSDGYVRPQTLAWAKHYLSLATRYTAQATLSGGATAIVDTSGGTFQMILPASPSTGSTLYFYDGADWGTTGFTINRNGATIEGVAEDLYVDVGGIMLTVVYDGTTWEVFASSGPKEVADQSGNTGKFLTTDGTTTSWASVTGGASIIEELSSSSSFYPVFTTVTSGTMTGANVATSKLYFTPSSGTLSATIFNSLSDITVKEDINSISSGMDVIEQIQPVSFQWKDTKRKSYGVIAQQIEKILPDIIETQPETGLKSVSYNQIIPFLVQAVKELSEEVKLLKGENNG